MTLLPCSERWGGGDVCFTEGMFASRKAAVTSGLLHGMRMWPVSWLVEEKYSEAAVFVSTAYVLWAQRYANGDYCLVLIVRRDKWEDCFTEGGYDQCHSSWKRGAVGSNLYHDTVWILLVQRCATRDCCLLLRGRGEEIRGLLYRRWWWLLECFMEDRCDWSHGWRKRGTGGLACFVGKAWAQWAQRWNLTENIKSSR